MFYGGGDPIKQMFLDELGNTQYLDQKMIDQLFIGMTKNQVKYVLGTPIINDTFTGNRWDYAYRYVSPSGKIEQKNLTLVFDEIENLGEIINNP